MAAPSRRRAFKALGVALALVVALAVGEVAARLRGLRPHVEVAGPGLDAFFWIRDRRLGFRNLPDARLEHALSSSVVTTGHDGERHGLGEVASVASPVVLFVGDSTTFCGEVNDDETGPSHVWKRLPPALGVGVVNAGVRGYNTIQATRMAEEWLGRRNVRAVVYTYCDNDYLENVYPFVQKPARAPAVALENGTLRRVELPDDAGPWGSPVGKDPPPPASIPVFTALGRCSALAAAMGDLLARDDAKDEKVWRTAYRWADDHAAGKCLELLVAELRDVCSKKSVPLLATRFTTGARGKPSFMLPDESRWIEAACRAAAVPFVDLSPAFTEDADAYRTHLLDGRIDRHYGRHGTETYGAALAPHVAKIVEGAR
jgi:hypothetical protein